ncbi:MAG TPA: GPR1/FUN34/YaaH family transporter, partial [Solirubrobacteraceae bacterium]|nr:GPR1/FUN34/YaaH family transporter [Solirubrobacteraceae bacterium]
VLVLGLNHNWFAIPAANVTHSVALFQISWAVVMAALTIATVRLPVAFTAVIALVVVALVLLIIGTLDASTSATKAAGYVTFVFAALGTYLFLSAASAATGGKAYPLGPPLVR